MSKELVVSATRHETRIAILEDDSVVEIYYQREKEYSLAGSIHKGKVTRVLPGMQSAFVDIGLERDAFLYVSDFFEDNEEYDKVVTSVEDKVLKLEKTPSERISAEKVSPAELTAPSPDTTDVPSELTEVEGETASIEPAVAELKPAEVRHDRENRGDNRDRESRRGRGRRGRRRRGSGGGLPESKFYSPRKEDNEEVALPGPSETGEDSEGEFAVLPGESLAKYSAAESQDESVSDEEEGGDGEELSRVTEMVLTEEASEIHRESVRIVEPPPLPAMITATPEVRPSSVAAEHPRSDSAPNQIECESASIPVEPGTASSEQRVELNNETPALKSMPAYEASESELPEDVDSCRATRDDITEPSQEMATAPELSAGELAEAELTTHSPVIEEAVSEDAIVEDEGPEPARIPTSLTAALREQGNRFPHHLSRRARRKMRAGGFQGEHRNAAVAQPGETTAENRESSAEPSDAAVLTIPESSRQQRGRGDRPERERSDRPERPGRAERIERTERTERAASISELLRDGQEIIVQIAKEPLGQKGARITSHIALPGRFLVYMPTVDHVGVSRKIPSDEERQRLKRILQVNRTGMTGGFIVRTAGEGKTEEELRADMHFLYNLWLDMRQKAEKKPAPALLHHDLDLVQRILRDQLTSSFKTIWVDNEEVFENVLRFVQRFQPAMVSRVKLYTRTNPIFDEFSITAELEKALRPKVWLKSGGYIVINQTEALVAIDVNTGKYVGKSNRPEDTIVRVNTDAIREIVRQIRLRDLGGIIVVDFIDMDERKNRQKVMQALEEAMRVDRAPYKILAFNDFGLVAITRKRVKQSLERTLCTSCPSCEGAGYIKSVQTVVGEILQEAQKMAKLIEGDDVLLRVNPEVAKVLKSNRNDYLQEIEEIVGRTVLVKSDPTLHQTKFDLA